MFTNYKRRVYRKMHWEGKDILNSLVHSTTIVFFLAYFFYRSPWAILPLVPVGIIQFYQIGKRKEKERIEVLTNQFAECILSVSASLKAGYAVENAFLESRRDMEMLYGKNSYIYKELEGIRRGLMINIALEEQLKDLAERSGSEEIAEFAAVFIIAKRNGGNLTEIIEESASLIGSRVKVRAELQTMLSGRYMEQSIMKMMPFVILSYIGVGYPGYFDPLYHNWLGVLIMTGCLGIYLIAYLLGERIFEKITREVI